MDLLKELENAKTIGISGHIRPDGDCIGSVMGTYLFLKKAMPWATIIPMIEEPAPEFNLISNIEDLRTDFKCEIDCFDAYIGLDSSTKDRYGDALCYFENAKKKIVIDHHISNEGFGDVSLIDPDASSASELVYDVIDKSYLDKDIALALYIGIIHDTGVLHYSNTSPKTLRTVADLLEFDIDFSDIIDKTFYEKTRSQNLLLGRGLLESKLFADGKIITSFVTRSMMEEYGATKNDLDGIVNQMLYTKGVYVSAFFSEREDGEIKVSLRSNGQVDVAKISKVFEGGGHVRAAGFSLYGDFEEDFNRVLEEIKKQL